MYSYYSRTCTQWYTTGARLHVRSRYLKPKPTRVNNCINFNAHLACYKMRRTHFAGSLLTDYRTKPPFTEQTVYVWFTQQTKRVLRLQYGTRKAIPCINLDRQTYIQTDIHTYIQCSSWAGVAIARHCHASPSSTIKKFYISPCVYVLIIK